MESGALYEPPVPELVLSAVTTLRSKLRQRGVTICISGIDGSGKSTLAQELVGILTASGISARRVHNYKWHTNVVITPALLLYNRYFGYRIQVLDRAIYDNVAVLAARHFCPRWFWHGILNVVVWCYPKFDYHLQLSATFQETYERRQDTREARFVRLSKIYEEIARRTNHALLRSDQRLLGVVLDHIATET